MAATPAAATARLPITRLPARFRAICLALAFALALGMALLPRLKRSKPLLHSVREQRAFARVAELQDVVEGANVDETDQSLRLFPSHLP